MQPSGKLHLGNYFGALKNWVSLQDEFECYFFVADWHALSSLYEDPSRIKEYSFDLAVDWLSAGLDPDKSTIFIQSEIPEHAELHMILSMIVPVPWLERNPTYKEKRDEIKNVDINSYGFLGYPVLQTADIVLYKADYVPVGIDQAPHLEISREIVRRFHKLYKKKVFIEPEAKISDIPKLSGLDGRKMSKTYNNAIFLSDSEKEIGKKVKSMLTDPARARRDDPGKVLNRPATQQNMPVRLSCWYSESGRNGKHFSTTLAQRSKEFWETHVVTNRQAHLGVGHGNQHRLGSSVSSS